MEEVKEVATVVAPKKVLEAAGESGCGGAALESRGGEGRRGPGPAGGHRTSPRGAEVPGTAVKRPWVAQDLPFECPATFAFPLPAPPSPPLSPPPRVTFLACFSLYRFFCCTLPRAGTSRGIFIIVPVTFTIVIRLNGY